ncbi:M15 family metallopeptidase [Alkaliphilus pronyensis]|uniref:M15 family metallopeptidase n=1 Tax=Alkaliphilus pronyensis TaxID=1482732 RepID=A0A6I0F4Z8_9FIRM|nr:M15 family metallopeptidase [Alkaliphilus pronyensis]KAB3529975.1 M15 family metallopeptidase [Alkaliphilus pronyensis]
MSKTNLKPKPILLVSLFIILVIVFLIKDTLIQVVQAKPYIAIERVNFNKQLPNYKKTKVWGENPLELINIPFNSKLARLNLYQVYVGNQLVKEFYNYDRAVNYAINKTSASIKDKASNIVLWNNYKRYVLMEGDLYIHSLEEVLPTIEEGKKHENSYIIDQEENKLVWSNFNKSLIHSDDTKQGDVFLVNRQYQVSSNYSPQSSVNLADHTSKYIKVSRRDMYIDEGVLSPIKLMLKDAYYGGADKMLVISGYRSYQRQTSILNSRIKSLTPSLGLEEAKKKVATFVAIPGSSEHQVGLAVDFTTFRDMGVTQDFGNTIEGKWLNENSWKYGFIIRYTGDKMDITGIIDEPWHLRYVGIPHAEIMKRENLCLEEYLDNIKEYNKIEFEARDGNKYNIVYFESIYSEDLIRFLYEAKNIEALSGDGKGGVIITTID